MKVIAVAVVVLALLSFASAAWTPDHEITGDASKLISDGVKATLYNIYHLEPLITRKLPIKLPPTLSSPILIRLMIPRELSCPLITPLPINCSPFLD